MVRTAQGQSLLVVPKVADHAAANLLNVLDDVLQMRAVVRDEKRNQLKINILDHLNNC